MVTPEGALAALSSRRTLAPLPLPLRAGREQQGSSTGGSGASEGGGGLGAAAQLHSRTSMASARSPAALPLAEPPILLASLRAGSSASEGVSGLDTPRPRSSVAPAVSDVGSARASTGGSAPGSRPLLPAGGKSAMDHLLGGIGGWAPIAYKAFEAGGEVLLEDQRVLSELSKSMVEQLNTMFAFMSQVMVRERARHSSSVSMMMRKVDKDLRDTYNSVKELFSSLTDQLVRLVKEVENSRKQVKSIQDKYSAAREAAEAQAQYVLELEAVLEGQCAGITETMRKLNDQAVSKGQALLKSTEESKTRERRLKAELQHLREELKKAERAQNVLQSGFVPPALPEMTASWTRRGETPGSAGGGREGTPGLSSKGHSPPQTPGLDIVGSVLAHCDAGRGVPRSKRVRMPPVSARGDSASGLLRSAPQKAEARLRRRAELAEARCERLHQLVIFASAALLLLRDVFGELRGSGFLTAGDATGGKGGEAAAKLRELPDPGTVLEQIVHLFQAHVPKLGSLPEVLRALSQEASQGPLRPEVEDTSGVED